MRVDYYRTLLLFLIEPKTERENKILVILLGRWSQVAVLNGFHVVLEPLLPSLAESLSQHLDIVICSIDHYTLQVFNLVFKFLISIIKLLDLFFLISDDCKKLLLLCRVRKQMFCFMGGLRDLWLI